MPDYIPGSDNDFQAWAANFVTYANAHLAELGIGPPDELPYPIPSEPRQQAVSIRGR